MTALAESTAQADEVLAGIRDMYDAFLANDRSRFDSHLDGGCTTWENHFPHLMSRAELDDFRDRRTDAERPVLEVMEVAPLRVEAWGDSAFAAYHLVTRVPGGADVTTRITDVLARIEGDWRIVHHHAQGSYGEEGKGGLA